MINRPAQLICLINNIVLGLRNPDLFNKHIGLVLIHIIEYSLIDMRRTQHMNTNYYPLSCPLLDLNTNIRKKPPQLPLG